MATVNTRRTSTPVDRNSQIMQWYRDYTGSAPDSHGWGTNIDDRYAESIRQSIYNSQAAQDYRNRPTDPVPSGVSGSGSGGSGTTFSDPATQRWENATVSGANRLMTPLNNPDFQSYVDYMRQYFQRLQRPGYTAAEQDLMQTQALDPMERQRQAARRQVQERMARSGIANSANGGQGGLVERAMQNVDQQFNELRTRTQSGFAASQINAERQREQQAAQVGAALSQAQQAAATNDEARMLQALNLLWQIPQYADSRLQLANSVMQPMDPAGLIAAMSGIQQSNQQQSNTNYNNNQAWWNYLGNLLYRSAGGR